MLLSMPKNLVSESSYRLQMVENKIVGKSSFPFQKENFFILVVDNKRGSFVIGNSFSLICE